ncbi:MAG: hypothetical protein JXA60_03285 [Candidatus Coatesbacteria bacterium]|nr:hypothetical protein [Candidatus Coatesbacteria bacterium]
MASVSGLKTYLGILCTLTAFDTARLSFFLGRASEDDVDETLIYLNARMQVIEFVLTECLEDYHALVIQTHAHVGGKQELTEVLNTLLDKLGHRYEKRKDELRNKGEIKSFRIKLS